MFMACYVYVMFFFTRYKNESYAERQHIYVHVVLIGFYTDSLPQFQYLLIPHTCSVDLLFGVPLG
jgi:hypothetical protein